MAVLDVDFHHGNGTQDIFYDRSDVLFVSLHGDPIHAFPYFSGHAKETGVGDGEGYNANLPLRPAVKYDEWGEALETALDRIRKIRGRGARGFAGGRCLRIRPNQFLPAGNRGFRRLRQQDLPDCACPP